MILVILVLVVSLSEVLSGRFASNDVLYDPGGCSFQLRTETMTDESGHMADEPEPVPVKIKLSFKQTAAGNAENDPENQIEAACGQGTGRKRSLAKTTTL